MWNPKDLTGYETRYRKEVQALNIHRKAMEQSMLVYTEHARQLNQKQKPSHKAPLCRRPFQTRLAAALSCGDKLKEKERLDYTYPFYQQHFGHEHEPHDRESPRRPASELQLCVGRPLSRWISTDPRPATDMNGNIISSQKLFPFSPRRAKLGVFKSHQKKNIEGGEGEDLVLSLEKDANIVREEDTTHWYPGKRQEGLKAMSLILHDKSPRLETSLENRRLSLPNPKRRKKSNKNVTEKLPQVEDQSIPENNPHGGGIATTTEGNTVNQLEGITTDTVNSRVNQLQGITTDTVHGRDDQLGVSTDKRHGMHVVRLTPTSSGSPGCKTPTLVLYQSDPRDKTSHIKQTKDEPGMEIDDESTSNQQPYEQSQEDGVPANSSSVGQTDEDLDNVTSAADMAM